MVHHQIRFWSGRNRTRPVLYRSDAWIFSDDLAVTMNLRSRLFKKPWQQKDPATRAQAVQESDDSELREALPELAQHDPSPGVRLAALKRINTEPFWLDARLRESDGDIRAAADAYLVRSVGRTSDDDLRNARLDWFATVEDAGLVRRMAAEAADPALRRAALGRINAQGFLGDRYASESDDGLAAELLERIDQVSTLERLSERLRRTSKQRARAVARRLADLRAAGGQNDPDHEAAEDLVRQIESLARGGSEGNQAEALERLEGQWSEVREPDATLARRFEGAAKIVRAALDRPAPAPSEAVETDETQSEQSNPDSALNKVADRIHAAFRQRQKSLKPAELLGDWDRAWNQIKTPSDADRGLKDELLPLLRELQAQIEQKAAPKAPPGKSPTPDPAADFGPRLNEVADSLESGDIARSHELIRQLRSDFDRLPRRSRPREHGGRLQRMEGRLKEMRNWQHWSNNQHRDELIERLEALPGSGQHPDAITAALKAARAEWQRLEKLEVLPGDRKRFAAPPGQWRRFQDACKNAFETAKPYFEKRNEVQNDNLEQLDKFIEMGLALAGDDDADSKKLHNTMRSARLAIRRLDDLPPKTRGRSAARLRELMDAVSGRLDERYERIELTKRRLVTEARALAHEKDLKTAIDKAKSLQAEWQKAGSGRRKIEQKLWEEFREPIDPLFEQLKGERDEQKQADKEALAELDALCDQAEALLKVPEDELESAAGKMAGLAEDWFSRGGRPPRLNQRFDKAETAFKQRLGDIEQAARERVRSRLDQLAASVQSLWERRLDAGPEDLATEMPEPADEDDALCRNLIAQAQALADADFDALEARVTANEEAARQVAVEMEFISGRETPEEDRKRRMDYQVKRLAERMSERGSQQDLPAELEALVRRWYESLPQPPAVHRELARRFGKSRELIENMIGQ